MALALNKAALAHLPSTIPGPAYDRSIPARSIVHIGVGGFFRSHQALYLDDLLRLPGHTAWGYCGVGLLPIDAAMRDAMLAQDCLYTLVERSARGDMARVVGSLLEFLYAPDDPQAVLDKLADPGTRIVSLTITEGGYYVNQGDGSFDAAHPDIMHDLAHPHTPHCCFGYLAEALARRRERGLAPFTVMSCDNLQSNGDITRAMLLAFTALRDPALSAWLAEHCAFPNVLPYEKMKLRLLNAGHQSLCYIGMLLGYEYAHEAMADADIRQLFSRMMDIEVTPLLPAVEGIDLADYKRTLVERFANPAIGDQLLRIGTDGSARMPKFVLPSVRDQLARGGPVELLSFSVACWFRYLNGSDEQGRPLTLIDPLAAQLRELAVRGGADPAALLSLRALFGELSEAPRFVDAVAEALARLYRLGARAALSHLLASAK
ncbi:mannitol dehydrogenase family protein [Massilia genomosp. 1]|uniref:Mannitol dehydrogenase family protein n=1 Tax=Massilia genomosp. 1 TaxID=2609280 RepID=A0ABX0N325_9BURK|nr:mannitol dehydrogenase family protein [Massilia genomosp. 1]NHZ66277.1 mannitol dehydrogenase family protein [Massilia genomosp. 1]